MMNRKDNIESFILPVSIYDNKQNTLHSISICDTIFNISILAYSKFKLNKKVTEKLHAEYHSLLDRAWHRWYIPEPPRVLCPSEIDRQSLSLCASGIGSIFNEAENILKKTALQVMLIEWLYSTVRSNIKRGRIYSLSDVLKSGQADCLGYACLFAGLGVLFGLEHGVIEVIIDNAGRYIPHYVNLAHLADNSLRFVDAWYDSSDIRHRRIAALVNGAVTDINIDDIKKTDTIEGLPADCIRALTLYIEGNRFLERNDTDAAIACYSNAIPLFPSNSRIRFNRAIAYERKGRNEDAEHDYKVVCKDDAGIARILANVDALEGVIKLDELHISERDQDIYLLYKGFKTGEPVTYGTIQKKFGVTSDEVDRLISRIDTTK